MSVLHSKRRIHVVAAAIVKGDMICLFRRNGSDVGGGMFEFPGGKVEVGESPEQALRREIQEELGVRIKILNRVGKKLFSSVRLDIDLELFIVNVLSEDFTLVDHSEFKWVRLDQISMSELAEPDRPFVSDLVNRLQHKNL